ncbi:LCP family protein [Evansella sp. AB-P1]|uniref:LCP family glycopolymer transferase n=1 Tax=Evansella sp. AB-P1 TaxID=3037653 RepID=UPI00241FA022|nr:LCP family protein [Evansella sp. AB-P1]MDG5786688.1 LCP family protein [Evansella sp. AB-P1]
MTQSRTEYQRSKKKKPKKKLKITLYTLLVLLLLVGGGVAYVASKILGVTSSAELDRGAMSDLRENTVNPSKDPISILFLGLDSRDEDLSGRTDAMIFATFNPEDSSIKMLNIPRDSRVEIVGRDRLDKINHAHAFGGVDMTVDTVENLLQVPVDYIVSLNFIAFMEIVDELGGVNVNVPFTFTEKDNATYGTITLHEGEQTLNGQEALAYVRMRKSDPMGDLGRGERQKEVIESIIRQSASFSSITRFGPIMDSLGNNLKTNLSFGNIVSMHTYASSLGNIESLTLEGDNRIIEGIYYYELRDESVQEISRTFKEHLNMIEKVDQDINTEVNES